MNSVTIIGAGLAGCEAALQLASNGYKVTLFDSKPRKILAAYKLSTYSELVCNNSLGCNDEKTPLGILLKELRLYGSKLISIAEECCVDDPLFLAVDKNKFSRSVTNALWSNKIQIINEHICSIPDDDNIIIATGPLTEEALLADLHQKYGIKEYHFSDASSPIVDISTVNVNNSNIKKITEDAYAVLISHEDFRSFYEELLKQNELSILHDIDQHIDFEKCKSIEQIAKDGIDELYLKRFSYNYCNSPCLLLRRESALSNGFILVGCMTTLRHSAQRIVFSKITGFENCKLIKYGRMHRNTFLDSPKVLNEFFQIKGSNTFIAGQLSGVDGYAPSVASGLVAARRIMFGSDLQPFPKDTMIGGLAHYISNTSVTDFQPMCASFSLIERIGDDS